MTLEIVGDVDVVARAIRVALLDALNEFCAADFSGHVVNINRERLQKLDDAVLAVLEEYTVSPDWSRG